MIKYTVPPKGYESWAEFAHKVGIHKLKTALLSPQDFISGFKYMMILKL